MSTFHHSDGSLTDDTSEAERLGSAEAGTWLEGHAIGWAGSPLLDVLRQRAADARVCRVHLLDSSTLYGTVTGISDDGRVGVIADGRDEYAFDVSFVAVVQTAAKAGNAPQEN